MGRLLLFLLGLAVVALGWAIHDPAFAARSGGAGILAATLNAGLEPFRQLIAGGIGVLGVLLLLGSVAGRRSKPKPRPTSRPQALVEAPLDAPTEPASPPESETFPGEPDVAPVAFVDEAPFPAEAAPVETATEAPALDHGPEVELTPPPVVEATAPEPAPETFEGAREHLRVLAREENWPAVGRVLGRLPRLAATETEQALAAQDLGVFHRSQGRTDDAAEAFEMALGHARGAAPADPALLAAALTDVGDVALEQSRLETAINAYVELVDIRRTAAAAAPSADNRRLLSLALERLADAREDRGHRTRALALYQESMAIAGDLAAADPAKYGADLAVTRRRLAELEAALAN